MIKITNFKKFEEEAKFNRISKPLQSILKPIRVGRYFVLTRMPFITKKTIESKAKLFFDFDLYGQFPDPVFSFAFLHHFLEEDLTFVLLKYLKPGMTFIDAGAHIGYFSILGSFLVGEKGKVYSFEVTPNTLRFLRANTKNLSNVTVIDKAVWSSNKKMQFLDYGPFYAPCNSYTEGKIADNILKDLKPRRFKVTATSLDSYCEEMKIKPDFIKIDVESAEYQALKGMRRILIKYKPIISIEIGDKPGAEVLGSKDCIKLLASFGYDPYNFENGRIVKHKIRENYYLMFGNLLFLPKK